MLKNPWLGNVSIVIFFMIPWLSPATEGPPLLSQSVCVFCGLRRGGQRADTDKSFQQSRAGSARWGRGREHTPSFGAGIRFPVMLVFQRDSKVWSVAADEVPCSREADDDDE